MEMVVAFKEMVKGRPTSWPPNVGTGVRMGVMEVPTGMPSKTDPRKLEIAL